MSFGIRRFILLLFSFIKLAYYSALFLLPRKKPEQLKNKSILLIKLDDIGDYILFRNLLKYFKLSNKFQDHHITLCGNIIWKDIFELLDKDYVDNVIWVNKSKFSKNLLYRNYKINEVGGIFYSYLINCTLSRNFYIDDTLAAMLKAENKIGNKTDLSNQFNWQKKISDKYYSRLIKTGEKSKFEFYRNREYISKILRVDIKEWIPQIEKNYFIQNKRTLEDYAVFCLGARKKFKIWKVNNFVEVAKF